MDVLRRLTAAFALAALLGGAVAAVFAPRVCAAGDCCEECNHRLRVCVTRCGGDPFCESECNDQWDQCAQECGGC